MRYRLTVAAEHDLLDIDIYGLGNFGEAQAKKYHDELERTFELLADNPEMARRREEFSPPVRIHLHARHYIVYADERDQVLILRILGADMDLFRHLGPAD